MRLTSIPLIKKDIKKNFSKSKKLVKQPNLNFSKLEHYQPNQKQVEQTKTLKKILGGGALALAVLGSIFAKKSIDSKTTKYVKTLTKSMNLHFNTNFKPENLKSVISGKELLKELQSLKKENYVATVENLDYLKRAGRVKATSAFFGNLFGVKPIIISDAKGQNYALKKIKGRRASLLHLVEYLKENIVDSKNQIIYIGHADSVEDAEFVKEHIEREVECKGVYIDYIGPIVGVSVGPGTIAVYYVGQEVTVIGD